MFGDWRGNATNVDLLKTVLADSRIGDLPRDTHQRYRIHVGGSDTRDQIRRAWTARRDNDADLAACPCVAVRRVHRALFMPRQNVREAHLINFVVKPQDYAARVAENQIDALILQALKQCPRSVHLQNFLPPSFVCQDYRRNQRQRQAQKFSPRPKTSRP